MAGLRNMVRGNLSFHLDLFLPCSCNMVHVPEDLAVTVGYKIEDLSITDKLPHPNQYIHIPQHCVMCCLPLLHHHFPPELYLQDIKLHVTKFNKHTLKNKVWTDMNINMCDPT